MMTHYGFLSTYPPTHCGLATFTEALAGSLVLTSDEVASIVRVLDEPGVRPPAMIGARSRVLADLIAGDRASIVRSAAALNACDIAIVQHEYGIFGGEDGDEIFDVLAAVEIPCIVVLHTVLASPTEHQREVLTTVCALASVVVVMTQNASQILADNYVADLANVRVIPHGVPTAEAHESQLHARKRVLTWGLISPGKGVEWGIRAMAQLTDIQPPIEYVVAGQTHPKVLAKKGEEYRTMLTDLVDELDLGQIVSLDSRYQEAAQLAALVQSADVVLLPYDSRDQATSGVLAEAVAAGIPVVATGFPHAIELLATGAGIIAAHEDPQSMADALRTILTGGSVADDMRAAALRAAGETTWAAVATQYRSIAAKLVAARAA
jgi:glycosyltransferase involved in cell wall biosynthesis